jgi:hypothetical protein
MMLSTVLQILRHDVFCLPFEAKAREWSDPWEPVLNVGLLEEADNRRSVNIQ